MPRSINNQVWTDNTAATNPLQQMANGDIYYATGVSTGTWSSEPPKRLIGWKMPKYIPPVIKAPDGKLIQRCLLAQLEVMAVERSKEIGLTDEPDAAQAIRVMFGLALMEIRQLNDRIAALEAARG